MNEPHQPQSDDATVSGPGHVAPADFSNDATLPPSHATGTPAPVPQAKSRERVYDLCGEVARGGMGAVLRARDLNIKRTVAMKVVLAERADNEELVQRFKQEAELTGQLEHPNIVPVHDLSSDEQGRAFYTMKFVQGVTLQEILSKLKDGDASAVARYPLAQLLTIFQKVCDAVAYAHSRGVVHRDLKPPNVMIGEYGEVLVMDWGLAKRIQTTDQTPETTDPPWPRPGRASRGPEAAVEPGVGGLQSPVSGLQSTAMTMAGTVMGSPQYMAPEQAAGKVEEIDARTDVFALGGILYHVLTLHPPVSGDSIDEMLEKIRTGAILPPSSYNTKSGRGKAGMIKVGAKTFPQPPLIPLRHCPGGRIPESLGAVAMKALALKREDRYQTVLELQQDLAAYQGGFATGAEHAGTLKLLWLLIRRHQKEFALAAVAVVVLVATVTGFMVRVVHEKNRTAAMLESLRKTAPVFRDQALAEVKEHRLPEALEKIAYAIELRPEVADYHYLRGNFLQTSLRLDEAQAAYRAALARDSGDALAQENLALCEKLRAENAGRTELSRASLLELRGAMVRQSRLNEANVLLAKMGKDIPLMMEACRAAVGTKGRVELIGGDTIQVDLDGPKVDSLSILRGLRIDSLSVNNCQVTDLSPLRGMALTRFQYMPSPVSDLSPLQGMPLRDVWIPSTKVADLGPLKGMPLTNLWASGTNIRDLSPLRGMLLKSLDIGFCKQVTDLSPLEGMALEWLHIPFTAVADLRPLHGMRLRYLNCSSTLVTDLSPLKGMPLEVLVLNGTRVTDLTPLADCRQLENLVIPINCKNIECFRSHPTLKRLSFVVNAAAKPSLTVAEFWKEYDTQKARAADKKPGS